VFTFASCTEVGTHSVDELSMLAGTPDDFSLCSQCDMTALIAALYQDINVNQTLTSKTSQKLETTSWFEERMRMTGQKYGL